jgi:hypothetical protein
MTNVLIEHCSWSTNKLCYLLSLFKDDTQYVTWALVFLGWLLTIVIAVTQYKTNCKALSVANHNEWVREFKEKLGILEDEALLFWTTNKQEPSAAIIIAKLTRNVKEITTIARDIEKVNGAAYQKLLFKDLRQSVTNDTELTARPLTDTHYRVLAIKKACSELRRAYVRKSN